MPEAMAVSDGPFRPTGDLADACAQLEEHGACAITGVLDEALLTEVRATLYRVADGERRRGWLRAYEFGDDDPVNQRVWNLPSRDPVFCDLVEHPVALEIVKRVIGWPASLSSMSANIVGFGGANMVIHCDQGYLPEPWAQPWVVNLAWCVDDFTAENGATLVAPGTHRRNRNMRPDEPSPTMVPVEAPAGSLIVLDGRLWHTNGCNRTQERRAGLFTVYTLPILLPQENWPLSLDPAIRQFGSETLQTLLGFRPGILGRVNGRERI